MSAAFKRWIPLTGAVYEDGMSGIRLATQAILGKLLFASHNDDGVVRLPCAPTIERSLRIFCPSSTAAEVRQAVRELTDPEDPIVSFEGVPFVRVARVLDPMRWLGHMGTAGARDHGSESTRADVQRTGAMTDAERAKAYRARKAGVAASGPMRSRQQVVAEQAPAVTAVTAPVTIVTDRHGPSRDAVTATVTDRHDASEIQIQNKIKNKTPPISETRAIHVVTPTVTETVTPAVTGGGGFSNSLEKEEGSKASEMRLRVSTPSRFASDAAPRSDATVFVDAVRRYTRNPAWMYKPPQRMPSNAQALVELEAMMTADGYDEPGIRADRIEALVGLFVDWCAEQGKEPEPDTFKTWITTHPGFRTKRPRPRDPNAPKPAPPPPPKPLPQEYRDAIAKGDFAQAMLALQAEHEAEAQSPGRPGLARTEPPPMTADADDDRQAAAQ